MGRPIFKSTSTWGDVMQEVKDQLWRIFFEPGLDIDFTAGVILGVILALTVAVIVIMWDQS